MLHASVSPCLYVSPPSTSPRPLALPISRPRLLLSLAASACTCTHGVTQGRITRTRAHNHTHTHTCLHALTLSLNNRRVWQRHSRQNCHQSNQPLTLSAKAAAPWSAPSLSHALPHPLAPPSPFVALSHRHLRHRMRTYAVLCASSRTLLGYPNAAQKHRANTLLCYPHAAQTQTNCEC